MLEARRRPQSPNTAKNKEPKAPKAEAKQGSITIGLPLEIQERLLLDLEDPAFASTRFLHICNLRPEYGSTGSLHRRSVQNKVNWYKVLKRKDLQKYNLLLLHARQEHNRAQAEAPSGPVEAQFSVDNEELDTAYDETCFDITMRSWASNPQSQRVTTLVAKKDTHLRLGSLVPHGSPAASISSQKNDPSELFSSYEEAEVNGKFLSRPLSVV